MYTSIEFYSIIINYNNLLKNINMKIYVKVGCNSTTYLFEI